MSFQSLAFFGFLAAALAVCLTAGRRSPRAGAAMLAAASAVFYLLGPGGWTVVLGGIACLLAGICVTACAIRRMARSGGRRRTMVLACVYHIAILVGFKYTEFLTGGFAKPAAWLLEGLFAEETSAVQMLIPAFTPWKNILRVVLLYGAGMVAVLWPRNTIRRMEDFRPTLWRGAALTVLTLWCVLSFTGVTTFIYSNF